MDNGFGDLLTTLLKENGAIGGLCVALFYMLKNISFKVDKLLIITNRVFALSLALSDKRDRKNEQEGGEV